MAMPVPVRWFSVRPECLISWRSSWSRRMKIPAKIDMIALMIARTMMRVIPPGRRISVWSTALPPVVGYGT